MRKNEARGNGIRQSEFGHDRHEVVAIRTQTMQPDDRSIRGARGLYDDAVLGFGDVQVLLPAVSRDDEMPGSGTFSQTANPRE